MKKLVIFFITVIICLGASITVSANIVIPPHVYFNDTLYDTHDGNYKTPYIAYNKKEFTLVGEINNFVPATTPFDLTENGTSNFFPIGSKIYRRNSDNELFVLYEYNGKEYFEHLIPWDRDDSNCSCFDAAITEVALNAGVEE